MDKNFLYLDYSTTNIDGKDFIVIYVLEYYRHQVFRVYKPKSKEVFAKLEDLKPFDNINGLIDYVIKSNNKIALNINFK